MAKCLWVLDNFLCKFKNYSFVGCSTPGIVNGIHFRSSLVNITKMTFKNNKLDITLSFSIWYRYFTFLYPFFFS